MAAVSDDVSAGSKQRWLPLEANPDVMNTLVHGLGVPEKFKLVDVFGFDEELLALVPKPVIAVLLLFPITDKYEEFCTAKDDELQTKAKASGEADATNSNSVYFIKQTIGNACGTIALIHAIGNTLDKIELGADSVFKKFFDATKEKSPAERSEYLEKNEGISAAHSKHALLGQTEAPSVDEKVNLHFIALVNIGGELYELDGRKGSPVKCGTTTEDSFLSDAARVCKEYMQRDPTELRFSLVALTAQ